MFGSGAPQLTGFLQIIQTMMTPAILILASGNLVSSTLTRLARITDRARELIEQSEQAAIDGDLAKAERHRVWLRSYRRRSDFAERALVAFYAAIGLFIISSLTIAADRVVHYTLEWLPVALVIGGVLFQLIGTAALLVETNMATGILRLQIGELDQILDARRSAEVAAPGPKPASWPT